LRKFTVVFFTCEVEMLEIQEIIRVVENHLTNLRNMRIHAVTIFASLVDVADLDTKIIKAEQTLTQLRTLIE
jgi:hypothetical protein